MARGVSVKVNSQPRNRLRTYKNAPKVNHFLTIIGKQNNGITSKEYINNINSQPIHPSLEKLETSPTAEAKLDIQVVHYDQQK